MISGFEDIKAQRRPGSERSPIGSKRVIKRVLGWKLLFPRKTEIRGWSSIFPAKIV